MNKEKAVSTSLIPVLQDILTAPEPDSLLHASHALNACLVTSPVEQSRAASDGRCGKRDGRGVGAHSSGV